jgi:hypothetical protein
MVPKYFGFEEALKLIKQGKKVKRAIWGGYWYLQRNVVVDIIPGDSMDSAGVISRLVVAKLKDGGYAPATAYQEDFMAEDWEEVEDEISIY